MKNLKRELKNILVLVILTKLSIVAAFRFNNDSTQMQLPEFAMETKGPIGMLTTSNGIRVTLEDTQTINSRLLLNNFFTESITELVQERVVERLVHAKAFGVFGYFKVTHDLSDICKAKVFNTVGKKTPVFVRFSTANQRSGGIDTSRDIRGFAIKFYTEEGNLDLLALNVEMFGIKDAIVFPAFVRVFHRNPKTHVLDSNMIWDFNTLRPESLHLMMRIFGDRGIPDGYRHMPGFTIHSFQVTNKHGDRHFVRFHILPDAGIRNLTTAQAQKIQGQDVDYATRDLYNAIHNGNYPSWTVYVQTISYHDLSKADFDIFDVTKVWPLKKYPLRPIGTIVLNRIPDNHFATTEQVAMFPGNLVPGITAGDTLFESRLLAYRSAQNYRLGKNFNKIEINCPLSGAKTYNRDGKPPVLHNGGDSPNYYPNSFNGPMPYESLNSDKFTAYTDPRPNNFDQARELYANELSEAERCRLVENIVSSLGSAEKFIQERTVKVFKLIHEDLAKRISYGLYHPMKPCDKIQH